MTHRIRACLGLFRIAVQARAACFPPTPALLALPSPTPRHRKCPRLLPSFSPQPPSLILPSPPRRPSPSPLLQRPPAQALHRRPKHSRITTRRSSHPHLINTRRTKTQPVS